MKRFLILLFCLLQAFSSQAQDILSAIEEMAQAISESEEVTAPAPKVKYWQTSASLRIGSDQTKLFNWAAGGYNTATLSTNLDARANYAKNLTNWNNRLLLDYTFLYSDDKKGVLQKSNDRIYLESNWAHRTSRESKWSYSASYTFRSQFTETPSGYSQQEDGKWIKTGIKSDFLSPAYTTMALGMYWKPRSWFDLNMAPLTGGFTFCMSEDLRPGYGMKPDENGGYHKALFQFGTLVTSNVRFTVNDVFNVESQLVLFSDYLNEPFRKVRVNWDNRINWQLTKLFSIGLSTWMIYDPIVKIKSEKDIEQYPDGKDRVQFKEFLALSLVFNLK